MVCFSFHPVCHFGVVYLRQTTIIGPTKLSHPKILLNSKYPILNLRCLLL